MPRRYSPSTTEDPTVIEELLTTELNYVQANGIIELRERIAALYPGVAPDHLLVTVGCAEANYITVHTVLEPGEEMVMMLPNYLRGGLSRIHELLVELQG